MIGKVRPRDPAAAVASTVVRQALVIGAAALLLLSVWVSVATSASNAKPTGKRVGYITATGVSYYTCVAKGLKETVTAAGNTFVQAVSTADPASEVSAAEDLLAQKVDVVVVLSVNPKSGAAVINRVHAAGKKVVVINNDSFLTPALRKKVDAVYAWNFRDLGVSAGRIATQFFKSGTKAAAVEPITGGVHNMYLGFSDTVKKAGFKWLGFFPARGYAPAEVQKATEDLLTSHPDVQVIYTDDTEPSPAIFAAMRAANSKAVLIPTGGRDADRQLVRDGTLFGYSDVAAYPHGAGTGRVVNALLAGKPFKKVTHSQPIGITKKNLKAALPFCSAKF